MKLEFQQKFKEEKDQMEKIIENNIEKKQYIDLENKGRLLQEKNKTLFSEVYKLRKEMQQKDKELEVAKTKSSALEKKLVLA